MQKKKSFLILLTSVIAVLLLSCAFMLAPKTTAHADTEETHDHLTMTAINSYAYIENGELTTGAYVLTDNIDGNITVTGEVTLCLNGHTITGDGNGSVITVSENANFTLCDCQETGKITGGTGNNTTTDVNDTYGGGVLVYGSFTMSGGTISGNNAYCGGGVYVYGTFTMYGGKISNNSASYGGVYVYGSFTMSGGTISGNNAIASSGGVYVSGGTFEMSGGEISGNNAYCGGGVYVTFGSDNIGGTFKMTGGTISANNSMLCGGVGVEYSTFIMEDGSIVGNIGENFAGGVLLNSCTFKMSGTPVITGNKATIDEIQVENNVRLFGDNKITVTGELTEGAKIGVYDTGEMDVGFTQGDKASKYFIPDNPENCAYVSDETSGTITVAEQHDIITHEAKQPTCTEKGWEAYEGCSRCDYATDKVEIDALGHTEELVNAVSPTCTENGLTAGKRCSVCNTVLEGLETVEALGHTEVSDDNAVAATCTQTGLTASTSCSVCNTVVQEQTTVPALGHKYGDWVTTKEATESEDGEQRRVCENDEAHYETRTLPKLTPSTPTPEKPSAPTETKSYWWLFWLLIPLAIGVGGVTLGIWVYKNDKKNNRK